MRSKASLRRYRHPAGLRLSSAVNFHSLLCLQHIWLRTQLKQATCYELPERLVAQVSCKLSREVWTRCKTSNALGLSRSRSSGSYLEVNSEAEGCEAFCLFV